jgi:hypothetical protein
LLLLLEQLELFVAVLAVLSLLLRSELVVREPIRSLLPSVRGLGAWDGVLRLLEWRLLLLFVGVLVVLLQELEVACQTPLTLLFPLRIALLLLSGVASVVLCVDTEAVAAAVASAPVANRVVLVLIFTFAG